jgi:hypothetical protein
MQGASRDVIEPGFSNMLVAKSRAFDKDKTDKTDNPAARRSRMARE